MADKKIYRPCKITFIINDLGAPLSLQPDFTENVAKVGAM